MCRSWNLNLWANCLKLLTQGWFIFCVMDFCYRTQTIESSHIWISSVLFSQLPDFLGGSCTCPVEGGCLRSNKGPWSDPDIMKVPTLDINMFFNPLYLYFLCHNTCDGSLITIFLYF